MAEAHALLGMSYQFNRRTEDAVVAYKKAVELAPTNHDYRSTYGLLLGLTGKYDEGVAELKKVTADPAYKKEDAWVNLGWVYRNMTPPRIEDSVGAYKKALEIDPKNGQSALGMGWAYSYGKNWDGSIAAFEQAAKLDPKLAGEAYNGMAWAFLFKRDLPKAKEAAEKARAAGREDSRLATNIERTEKALAAGASSVAELEKAQAEAQREYEEQRKAAAKVEDLNRGLRSGSAAARRQAFSSLAGIVGPEDAVPHLIRALQDDPDWGVREAAVNALKNIGCQPRSPFPTSSTSSTRPADGQPHDDEGRDAGRDEGRGPAALGAGRGGEDRGLPLAAPLSLAGRKALVTGGASGIGRATVRRLLQDGAAVVIADANPSGVEQAVSELRPTGEVSASWWT